MKVRIVSPVDGHAGAVASNILFFAIILASPVGAAGRVYVTGRNGTTLVLDRSEKLKILASNELEDRFDSSAALAGNQLFLRGGKYLYCIAGSD